MMLTVCQHTRSQIDPRKCAHELRVFRFKHEPSDFLDPSQIIGFGFQAYGYPMCVESSRQSISLPSAALEIIEIDVIDGGKIGSIHLRLHVTMRDSHVNGTPTADAALKCELLQRIPIYQQSILRECEVGKRRIS